MTKVTETVIAVTDFLTFSQSSPQLRELLIRKDAEASESDPNDIGLFRLAKTRRIGGVEKAGPAKNPTHLLR